MPTSREILQGTQDLLILRTLATGEMHGWGVAQRIQQVSRDVLQIGQGSLYPAAFVLVLVALVATLIPARAAMKIEPTAALRYE